MNEKKCIIYEICNKKNCENCEVIKAEKSVIKALQIYKKQIDKLSKEILKKEK